MIAASLILLIAFLVWRLIAAVRRSWRQASDVIECARRHVPPPGHPVWTAGLQPNPEQIGPFDPPTEVEFWEIAGSVGPLDVPRRWR